MGYGNFFSSPGVNDHHARIVRGGDGQGEGGGAPEGGVWKFFTSLEVNDHHARVVRGGDGQDEGGGAPEGGVGKFFTSFNEETRSTAPRAPLICPSLDLYRGLSTLLRTNFEKIL